MERTCRGCGCTDAQACVVDGIPCHWVDPTLCSACEDKRAADLAVMEAGIVVTEAVVESVSINADGSTTTRMLLGFADGHTMLVDWPGEWTMLASHAEPRE